jgi:hypothetical protein
MNTGIVMIGLALILLSVALMVSPSDAAVPGTSCNPGCGCPAFTGEDVGQGWPYAGEESGECLPASTSTTDPASAP